MSKSNRYYRNSNNQVVQLDDFASSLEDIFGELDLVTEEALTEGVRAGARATAKEWRNNAEATFKGDEYCKSIRSRVVSKSEPKAVAYSKMPGLPHLLEKGHAKVGGGRVEGRTHIKPAADDGFEIAFETTKKYMDSL